MLNLSRDFYTNKVMGSKGRDDCTYTYNRLISLIGSSEIFALDVINVLKIMSNTHTPTISTYLQSVHTYTQYTPTLSTHLQSVHTYTQYTPTISTYLHSVHTYNHYIPTISTYLHSHTITSNQKSNYSGQDAALMEQR